MSDLCVAALAYATHGLPVFPVHSVRAGRCSCGNLNCEHPGKHPRTPHGFKDASTDARVIEGWWRRWPTANVGVAVPLNHVVLDIDNDEGLEALRQAGIVLDDHGPRVRTGGGGTHQWYRTAVEVRPTVGVLTGVDLRGPGSYVVAPPSVHVSGRRYEWLVSLDEPIPDVPAKLLSLLISTVSTDVNPKRPSFDTATALAGVPKGRRDDVLFRLACKLRRADVPQSVAERLVQEAAAKCHPPFPADDARRKVADAYARYPATFALTDLGNAERLVARHGDDLHFVHAWDTWLVWDGSRWPIDDTGEIERRAKATVRGMYAEAEAISDQGERGALAAHAIRSESEGRIKALIALAESEPTIPVAPAALDADPWLFNCANGTLDLRRGVLLPYDRAHLLTKMAPVTYDPTAGCTTWDTFLRRIMAGDEQKIGYLQRAVGYGLTGLTVEQVLFILYGVGANGKTTFVEAIKALLGPYAASTDPATFLATATDRIRNDLARLAGVRFVPAVEADEGRRFAEALVKQITGGDTITARFLHKEFFEFTPAFKVFLATNHKPVVRGTDHAIWRRIRLIPFTVSIPPAEQDRYLLDKLRRELSGILNWAVQGCLAWQREGLGTPDVVSKATADYRAEMDALAGFLADRCAVGEAFSEVAGALYGAYRSWCDANGEHPLNQTRFGTQLADRGFPAHRDGARRYRRGLRLCDGVTGHDGVLEEVPHEPDIGQNPSRTSPNLSSDRNPSRLGGSARSTAPRRDDGRRVWLLAMGETLAWRLLDIGCGESVAAGEAAWRTFCDRASGEQIARALDAVEAFDGAARGSRDGYR